MLESALAGGTSLLHLAVVAGGAVVTGFKSIKFVQEGSRGLKLRFGKVVRDRHGDPKIIEPGFVFMIPFVETLQRRHVRQQEVTLEEQTITLKSGLTFRVAGAVYFRVHDVYKALFDIENLDESIEQLSMGMLRDEVAKHENHHDLSDTEKIAHEIFEKIKERTDTWGVDLVDFRLTTCAPTSESAPIVNLESAATMRIKVINDVAEKLGVTTKELVRTGMAAILVGAPLVASSSVNTSIRQTLASDAEDADTSPST